MCVPVSPSTALQKKINMLTLKQSSCVQSNDDNNNTCLSPSALKSLTVPKPGLKRCLFGVPKVEDNKKILEDDLAMNRERMMNLWNWDIVTDTCDTSGTWAWEKMKAKKVSFSTPVSSWRRSSTVSEHRHHPYPGVVRVERTSSGSSTSVDFHLPPMISPIPPTPMVRRMRTTSTSSVTSVSSSSADDEVETSDLATLSPPNSSSDTWLSPRSPKHISCSFKVQTRLTDFWRTRRSSCSEGRYVKSSALAIEATGRNNEVTACSV